MPTMFIDTVCTNINSDNFQTVYDSRYKENAAKISKDFKKTSGAKGAADKIIKVCELNK